MTLTPGRCEELHDLVGALCDGAIDAQRFARLQALLADDVEAQRFYVRYLDLHGALRRLSLERSLPQEEREEEVAPCPSFIVHHPSVIDDLPSAGLLPPGGNAFSYGMATLILGIGLLIGWAWRISNAPFERADHGGQASSVEDDSRRPVPTISETDRRPKPSSAADGVKPSLVGHVTGMVDCRWTDPAGQALSRAGVPLGQKYALASGLLEITYDTGAKVILQGPCVYEVESARGGFLSLGKLAARVENTAEGGGRKGEKEVGSNSEIRKSKSEITPSTLRPPPSALFSVRTPTAIVTDLGTEFGVEVAPGGAVTSRVFRGAVRIQLIGDGDRRQEVLLGENESVRVERGQHAGAPRLVRCGNDVNLPAFVRRMDEPPKELDLLDVVAGGNGRGRHRNLAIDPIGGRPCSTFVTEYRYSGGGYWSVDWNKLIDGVFVPDMYTGAVQLDSVGHVFKGFPRISGTTYGSIVPCAADFSRDQPGYDWTKDMGLCRQFMPNGRGLLSLHANMGITFNLEAMRKLYPTARPARFRAVAGIGDGRPWNSSGQRIADFWVFVDGRLKFSRVRFDSRQGAVDVNVEIGADDRFITLVSTDGGNVTRGGWDAIQFGWVVFGDPVLQMVSVAPKESPGKDAKPSERDSLTNPGKRNQRE